MTDGTPSNLLGVISTDEEKHDDGGELFPEAEAPPQEPEAAEATEPEAVPEPEPEPAPEEPEAGHPETAPEPEAPQPEDTPLFMGKYKTQEAWEAAHRELDQYATRQGMIASEERRKREELEQTLNKAMPAIQAALQAEQSRRYQAGEEEIDLSDPVALQQFIEAQVQKGVTERTSQFTEQQQQEVARTRESQEVDAFRTAYATEQQFFPDVVRLMREYQHDGEEEVLPVNKANLETMLTLAREPELKQFIDSAGLVPHPEYIAAAREAIADPNLKEVLAAVPDLMDSEAGMAYARKQAAALSAMQTASQAPQINAQAAEQDRKAAFVERGEETQQPKAPGRKAADPLEEYVNELEGGRVDLLGIEKT